VVRSLITVDSASGRLPGISNTSWLLLCQSRLITLAISFSTPRVRWKFGSDDQSEYKRSKTSGWMG